MLPLSIKFQAYIPKLLGKPLLSYFQGHPRFNPNNLNNYYEFKRELQEKDVGGYTWLPEPGGFINNHYFATDNTDFHNHHSDHTARLALHAEIDLKKIGNYSPLDRIFNHERHKDWPGHRHQHSEASHRVKAYIKRIPFYTDMPRTSDKDMYIGVCSNETDVARAKEKPLQTIIKNKLGHTYLHAPGNRPANDTTVIKVAASAGYPFTPELITPNIDFELEIKLVKSLVRKSIDVHISGWHNDFPAYELIIGHRVPYTHNPSDHGYTGPGFGNLTKSRDFHATEWLRLDDWQIRELEQKNKFRW